MNQHPTLRPSSSKIIHFGGDFLVAEWCSPLCPRLTAGSTSASTLSIRNSLWRVRLLYCLKRDRISRPRPRLLLSQWKSTFTDCWYSSACSSSTPLSSASASASIANGPELEPKRKSRNWSACLYEESETHEYSCNLH